MPIYKGLTELAKSDRLTQGRWSLLYLTLLTCWLLSSCNTVTQTIAPARPYIEHSVLYQLPEWNVRQSKGIYSNGQVSEYLEEFAVQWKAHSLPGTDEAIRSAIGRVDIHWQQTKFINPEKSEKQLLLGYMVRRKLSRRILVFVYDCSQTLNPKLGSTALAHELIHVVLLSVIGSTHSDHYNNGKSNWSKKYKAFEDNVNERFK